jgi:RNA polymerase sigma factor (sigma-70 family)
MGAESTTPSQIAETVLLDARERRKLLAYARQRFRIGPEDAQDLLQETALELLRQRTHVESPRGFLFAVFRSRCCRYADVRRRNREVPIGDLDARDALGPGADAVNRQLALRQALQVVSSSCRRLLAAYYAEGQSLTETARAMALAPSGVFKTINRCLNRLKRCLI